MSGGPPLPPPPSLPSRVPAVLCEGSAGSSGRGGGWRANESGTRISISESLIKVFRLKKKERLARGETHKGVSQKVNRKAMGKNMDIATGRV